MKINIITIIIIVLFFMPVITGLLNPLSRDRIRHSLRFVVDALSFILSLVLSVSLFRVVFAGEPNGFLQFLNRYLPAVGDFIAQYHQDIVAYIIVLFVFWAVSFFILELLMIPVSRHVIAPVASRVSSALNSRSLRTKRIFSGLWRLPKSICMVLAFALLLNFYANFINNPSAREYINASRAYQTIQKNMLHPILSADLVKRTPVLVGEAFKKAAEDFTPTSTSNTGDPNYWRLPAIKYFNGVTIDEAVESNEEIDNTAKQVTANAKDEVEKARLLYDWVSQKISYDKEKVKIVMENPSRVNSGSIITFEERAGVCFDYSCLYVSMCRAADVKVRLVSGLGYNGTEWGEHVWNQIYDPKWGRWINVDPTFGNSGYNYFDNEDFSDSHKYDVVQAEW